MKGCGKLPPHPGKFTMLFLAFGVYWVGLGVVSWFVQYKLYKLLEKYHYEKWVWLGKPNILGDILGDSFPTINKMNPFIGVPEMIKITFRLLSLPLKGDVELDTDPRLIPYWKLHRIISWVAIISLFGVVVAITFFT